MWILILFFVIGGTKSIATTSIEFSDKAACERAANLSSFTFKTYDTDIRYICVPK